jgi:hypothetical protein
MAIKEEERERERERVLRSMLLLPPTLFHAMLIPFFSIRLRMDFLEALTFGALISATDPIAILSIFHVRKKNSLFSVALFYDPFRICAWTLIYMRIFLVKGNIQYHTKLILLHFSFHSRLTSFSKRF